MAEYILMPTLGFDMEEGTMGQWLKEVGDKVEVGDVLAEIESDKVTQELTARHAGVLLAQLVDEGQIIPVGSNLGIIGDEGEDISALANGKAATKKAPAAAAPTTSEKGGQRVAEAAPAEQPAVAAEAEPAAAEAAQNVTGEEFPGGVKATPVARRVAADKGIDLKRVDGSGPGGRITKSDVESFVERKPAAAPAPTPAKAAAPAPAAAVSVPSGPEQSDVELTRLRKAIARRMTESKQTIPHFQVTTAIDMSDALALRKQINDALPDDQKVSVNDLIVKACGLALRQFPNINASWGGDKLIRNNRVHVGTAVAVEGGLLTVVQKNTDVTPLAQVAKANREMIGRARSGKVQPDDIQGSTFSVSNLGGFDVYSFTAIINPPEAAILAVGSANAEAVVRNGQVVVRNIMRATCSADHRVTDGAEVAQFLQVLKTTLEQPIKLLL